jgi:hypothetical protein
MINIQLLNQRPEQEGAAWRAGETSVSNLSIDELRRLAGGRVPLKRTSPVIAPTSLPSRVPSPQFDLAVDWRARGGKSYVTPVRAQGGCGACTSFAVIGLVESMALIEPAVTLDLSEADLAFCGTHTNDCTGWDCDAALTDLTSRGAVTEARLPYFSDFLPNHTSWSPDTPQRAVIPDRDAHSVKVKNHGDIYDVAERKTYLSNVGPLVCSITCFDEFGAYKSGIFTPTNKAINIGGHDILVIGYSEAENYWLVKNSWDTSWGENGFGRIAYGSCDIDIETSTEKTYFTSCDGVQIPDRVRDEILQGVSATDLITMQNAVRCDAFYSPDDKDRHVIVGASDGTISEIFYRPDINVAHTPLIQVEGLVDLAALYTDDDKNRHVLTLDGAGNIKEVYCSTAGISEVQLANIPNGTRISGFYSEDDHMRHAIVATSDGKLIEVFYGKAGSGQSQIAGFGPIIDNARFILRMTDTDMPSSPPPTATSQRFFTIPTRLGGKA